VAQATRPQGSSLRSELCYLGPSSLNRPHPPHSQAHRDFTFAAYTRCLRCASKLPGLGSPRVVPSFHCTLFVDMSSSSTPGSPSAACTQFLRRQRWPSPTLHRLGTSTTPTPALPVGHLLRGFTTVRLRYNLPTCSPPLAQLTETITKADNPLSFTFLGGNPSLA
jgi:hypothetical protein